MPAAGAGEEPCGTRRNREEAVTDASGKADSEQTPAAAEHEPDARYTFANERTFLAWIRTALALVAAGLAVIQLLPPFHGIRWGRHAIGIPLIVLGGAIAVLSYRDWMANQRALRRDEPLPRSWLPLVLAVAITAVGLIAAVLVVLGT